MNLSPDTEAVLAHLDEITKGALRKKNDLGTILELSATKGAADAFNALLRTGTGLWKVYGTLRRIQAGAEGYLVLEREFGTLLNELRSALADTVQNSDDAVLRRFDETYFGMTQGVVRNLVDLAHDMSLVKGLQNDAR